MSDPEIIIVETAVTEKTFVGEVNFPVSVPEGLATYLSIPDDLLATAEKMGLTHHDVRFILGGLHGKWGLRIELNLPDLAPKLGLSFAEIDTIVRKLIEKNYGQLNGDQLNLYRFWIVLLHIKGVQFDIE